MGWLRQLLGTLLVADTLEENLLSSSLAVFSDSFGVPREPGAQ